MIGTGEEDTAKMEANDGKSCKNMTKVGNLISCQSGKDEKLKSKEFQVKNIMVVFRSPIFSVFKNEKFGNILRYQ